jgi:hypothetical protein
MTADSPAGHAQPSGSGEGGTAAARPASSAVPLSEKAIGLARRYRYANVGLYGGQVMPWADVRYRLQAWHGIRTTIPELLAAMDTHRPRGEL